MYVSVMRRGAAYSVEEWGLRYALFRNFALPLQPGKRTHPRKGPAGGHSTQLDGSGECILPLPAPDRILGHVEALRDLIDGKIEIV